MPIELKIPAVGESITEVQISQWLKAEGDSVGADEPLAVIDSEKTTFELPAPKAGRLTKILHQAGETVRVGEVIAQFEDGAESKREASGEAGNKRAAKTSGPPADGKDQGAAAEAGAKIAEPKPADAGREPAPPPDKRTELKGKESNAREKKTVPRAPAPPARETAAESGAQTKDAKTPSPPPPGPAMARPAAGGEEEIVPMTMLRRTVARRLVEAQQTMAMLTTINEVDMSAVQALRKQHQEAFEKRYQVKLGLMSFFVKAAIDALKQFPQLNAETRDTDIVYRNYFDVGVAIATDRGLVVPILRRAERLSFAELEQAIGEFAQRAKAGQLKPEDLEGGTFTITNGGVFGSLLSTPIINPPQSGILGLHTIQERPVAVDGQVVIRPMMYVALTYDHRIVDGREAVLFLRRLREVIESPARMLVEI